MNKKMIMLISMLFLNNTEIMTMKKEPTVLTTVKLSLCKEIEDLYNVNKKLDKNDFDYILERYGFTADYIVTVLNQRKAILEKEIYVFKATRSPLAYWVMGTLGSVFGIAGRVGYSTESGLALESTYRHADYSVLYHSWMDKYKRQLKEGLISQNDYNSGRREFERTFGFEPLVYEPKYTSLSLALMTIGLIAVPFAVYKWYSDYAYENSRKKEIATIDAIITQIQQWQQGEV